MAARLRFPPGHIEIEGSRARSPFGGVDLGDGPSISAHTGRRQAQNDPSDQARAVASQGVDRMAALGIRPDVMLHSFQEALSRDWLPAPVQTPVRGEGGGADPADSRRRRRCPQGGCRERRPVALGLRWSPAHRARGTPDQRRDRRPPPVPQPHPGRGPRSRSPQRSTRTDGDPRRGLGG